MPRFSHFYSHTISPHIHCLFLPLKKTTAEIVDNKKCITANVTKRHSINFYMLNIIWQTFYFSPLEICMNGKLPSNVLAIYVEWGWKKFLKVNISGLLSSNSNNNLLLRCRHFFISLNMLNKFNYKYIKFHTFT